MSIYQRLASLFREFRSEKRCQQVTIRVAPSMWALMSALADREGRSTSDYAYRVWEQHCTGHIHPSMFADSAFDGHSFRDSQRGALEDR